MPGAKVLTRPNCKRCNTPMVVGQALVQLYSPGLEDFIGDKANGYTRGQTMSPNGQTKLVKCWKCSSCGHSISIGETNA